VGPELVLTFVATAPRPYSAIHSLQYILELMFKLNSTRSSENTLGPLGDLKFAQESTREFSDGDLIFLEGDESREMYVVVSGEVTVSKKSGRGDVQLATLKKGDFVGEMSLLESLPRSATAKAIGKTKLLVIQPGGFLLKIRRDPTFAFEMLQTLSRRIRITNENLMHELGREASTHDNLMAIIADAEFHDVNRRQGA
jgi:CRP/FNR family cyclic AMP-dependent transcriptional regulator